MSKYYVVPQEPSTKTLSFERQTGQVNFIVSLQSGFNKSSSYDDLNRFFDLEYIKANANDMTTKGGRGQALLFSVPYQLIGALYGPKKDRALLSTQELKANYHLCLRHYFRGGMIGKLLKDSYWRFSSWAMRARLEFELCNELYNKGLPVPRPLIAREQVGTFFVKNDIIVEQIENAINVAELLERDGTLSAKTLEGIAQALVKFAKAKVVHSDLNIRNILLNEKNECFFIDFDHCGTKEQFANSDIKAMLSRIERSLNKEKELKGYEQICVETLIAKIKASLESQLGVL